MQVGDFRAVRSPSGCFRFALVLDLHAASFPLRLCTPRTHYPSTFTPLLVPVPLYLVIPHAFLFLLCHSLFLIFTDTPSFPHSLSTTRSSELAFHYYSFLMPVLWNFFRPPLLVAFNLSRASAQFFLTAFRVFFPPPSPIPPLLRTLLPPFPPVLWSPFRVPATIRRT